MRTVDGDTPARFAAASVVTVPERRTSLVIELGRRANAGVRSTTLSARRWRSRMV
jgi:hypothetical protein